MHGQPTDESPQEIGILLIPGFSMMAFTSAIEPLRSANRMSGRTLYRWLLYSTDGQPVEASNGISFMPDGPMEDAGRLSKAIVCAALGAETFNDRRVYSWFRRLARFGTHLGAISTGTYILARAGLLDGYKCTIHWESLGSFIEEFPQLEVSAKLFEIDRDRFTAAGGNAIMDLMLTIIAGEHGHDLSAAVAEQFIHVPLNDPDMPQRMPLRRRLRISHPKLLAVIEQMEVSLEEPLSREALADSVGLSTRQVERLFVKYLGKAPSRYYLELRLKRARLLLSQTSMPILDVSVACGFVSASHFSKSYREFFSCSPRSERTPTVANTRPT